MSKILYIMRGLPGSGKSTLTNELIKNLKGESCEICSTDNFHYEYLWDDENDRTSGRVWKYKPEKVKEYHQHNLLNAADCMISGVENVFIDNTNTSYWQMRPYVLVAIALGYTIILLDPKTPWAFDVDELVVRNTHGVPKEVIEAMLKSWQSSEDCYEIFKKI